MINANIIGMMKADMPKKDFGDLKQVSQDKRNFQDLLQQSMKTNQKASSKEKVEKIVENNSKNIQPNAIKEEKVADIQNEEIITSDNLENQEQIPQNLSDEDKKLLKDIGEELGINQGIMMKLLKTLEINLDTLKEQPSIKDAAQSVLSVLDAKIETLKIQTEPSVDFNEVTESVETKNTEVDIKDKIKFILKNEEDLTNKAENAGEDKKINVEIENIPTEDNLQPKEISKEINKDDFSKQIDNKSQQIEGFENKLQTEGKVTVEDKRTKPVKLNVNDSNLESGESSTEKVEVSANNSQTEGEIEKATDKTIKVNKEIENIDTKTEIKLSSSGLENNLGQNDFLKQIDKTVNASSTAKAQIVTRENIFEQVVETAKLILSDVGTEMEMNLKPESLGKLSLKVATENGMIVAKITTESQQVKQVIESNLDQLKEQLKQQGLTVQDFSVSVRQDSQRENLNEQYKTSKTNTNSMQTGNSVAVSENYINSQKIRNSYLGPNSTVNFVA